MVAGGETTARILTLAFFYILANASVLVRLQEEIDTAVPDVGKAPALKSLENLPFLVGRRSFDDLFLTLSVPDESRTPL